MAGQEKHLVLLDTDISLGTPGAEIDDGAALIALAAAPELQLVAVTAVPGNVGVDLAYTNAHRLLSQLGLAHLPVGLGAEKPLVEDKVWFQTWEAAYGETPPWPAAPDPPLAANMIIDIIRAHPGQITVCAIGPLTNLALAVRQAPDIASKVRTVITMGGSFARETQEFNCRCDPEAAHIVFNAGWPLKLIGLEVTRQVLFTRAHFQALSGSHPAQRLLKNQAAGWIDRVEAAGWEQGGCALHDAVAMVAILDAGLFDWQDVQVKVTLHEPEKRGTTTMVPAAASTSLVQVATKVQRQRVHDIIWTLIDK